jgi:glutaredoxin-related protein
MQRTALDLDQIHPSIHDKYHRFHADIVQQVRDAVARDAVVVVGMKTNPFVKRARKALEQAGIPFTYLEFGGYTSKWKERLAIKMWSGWPTFPQVYVHGRLIGGATDLEKLIAAGQLQQLLQAS